MNYFKGLVSNVRGFYSEINSATLTGAIDIVVIRQDDGSFSASPFHVRFGKLGVLRSREKIVDILINGEPVDLQMKLGEAGEAFFVEEVEEPSEVPSELSTTPIPSLQSRAATISESSKEEFNIQENECETPTTEEPSTPTTPSAPEQTAFNYSNENTPTADQEDIQKDKNDKEIHELQLENRDEISTTQSTQITNDENSQQINEKNSLNDTVIEILEKEKEETEKEKNIGNEEDKNDELVTSSGVNLDIEKNKEVESDIAIDIPDASPDGITRKDSLDDKDEDVSSHSFSESIPIPGRHVETSSEPQNFLHASILKEERFRIDHHLYPLSDLDSPIGSPPSDIESAGESFNPQHCLSDTEIERQQSQDNMNVIPQFTWDWGKLPQGAEGVYPHARNLNSLKIIKKKDHHHKSHKIKEEGIYLDDLTTIDQDEAALYLNQQLSKDTRIRSQSPPTEDFESGLGQSLPSSPTSELVNDKDNNTGSETYNNLAISLCGDLKSGKVPLESFIKSQVSFDDLSANPLLLSDPKLVIRINDRYYNWQIAAPMLMSYIIFQRPLKQEATKLLIKQHMPKKDKRRGYYWFWRQNEEQSSDEDDFDPTKEKFRSRVHSGSRKSQGSTAIIHHNDKTTQDDEQNQNEMKDKDEMTEEMNEQELMCSQLQRARNMSECTSGNESDVGYRKTTRLTSEQLANLNLHDGANSVHFSVTTKYQGTAECQATIYLWNHDDRIVISDIDGTITKSDVLGQILPVVGQAWAQSGVAQFFSSIEKNGYKLLYLSARAIGQAQITRDYLKSVKQDQITLPDGPLLLSPASLIKAFHREVIEKKPEEFKIAALRDILSLFPTNKKPFYSGFGNKINDAYSYRAVGVSSSRIFTINHKGEVTHELTTTFQSSYLDLQHLVDQMFPPYKKEVSMKASGLVAPEEFSSFTYWRPPIPEVDLQALEEQEDENDDIPSTFTG